MTVALLQPSTVESRAPDLSTLDDCELVERARSGRDDAFEQLVTRYDEKLKINIRRIVTGADLDDVRQQAWVKIYLKLDSLREPRLFSAWAARIATNEALGLVRRRGRRTMTDIDDLPRSQIPADTGPDAEERVRWRDMLEWTREWFQGLEARDREMFELFVVDGMTMEEIGEEVGMSSGGVKTRLFRAREQLRTHREAVETQSR